MQGFVLDRNVCVIIVINSFMTRVTWCITRGTATRVAWWSSPCPPQWPPSTACPGTCRRTAAAPSVGPGRPQCSRRSWEEPSVQPILSLDVFLTVILSSKIILYNRYLDVIVSQVHVHTVHGEVPAM